MKINLGYRNTIIHVSWVQSNTCNYTIQHMLQKGKNIKVLLFIKNITVSLNFLLFLQIIKIIFSLSKFFRPQQTDFYGSPYLKMTKINTIKTDTKYYKVPTIIISKEICKQLHSNQIAHTNQFDKDLKFWNFIFFL